VVARRVRDVGGLQEPSYALSSFSILPARRPASIASSAVQTPLAWPGHFAGSCTGGVLAEPLPHTCVGTIGEHRRTKTRLPMITVNPYVEVKARVLRDQLDRCRRVLPTLTDEQDAGFLRGVIERTEEELRKVEKAKPGLSS